MFKPMLAGKAPEDWSQLKFPVVASPKIDGIRCLIQGGVAVSRKLKPIPNAYVQEMLAGLPDGLDGELIVGDRNASDVWNTTSSGVMSGDGEPDFTYLIFDRFMENTPFCVRLGLAANTLRDASQKQRTHLELLNHTQFSTGDSLAAYEQDCVTAGYEGIMGRDPMGFYKQGRSTVREGGLLKFKRFQDAEAVVVDVTERFHNANEATVDALGHTKRSTHKANKVPTGTMGNLVCAAIINEKGDGYKRPPCTFTKSVKFEVGTGFTELMRTQMWQHKPIGQIIKFKYQHLTPDGLPLFPVFLGFRDERD